MEGTTRAANNWGPHLPDGNPASKIYLSQAEPKNKGKTEMLRDMQELGTWVFSTCTEAPSKKEKAASHNQKWEQAEGEKRAIVLTLSCA